MTRIALSVMIGFLGGFAATQAKKPPASHAKADKPLELGNFSVSLLVKDLPASRAFYEKLGFHDKHSDKKFPGYGKKWMVLQNETATIGLFQGGVEKNSLTFNPGWDRNSKALTSFDDVRDIQK